MAGRRRDKQGDWSAEKADRMREAVASARQSAQGVCGRAGCAVTEGLKVCAKCKCRRYCSRQCQVESWPTHKDECKRLAKASALADRAEHDAIYSREIWDQREQALDAKAEYWREKFRALEKAVQSRSGADDHAGPTITKLESKINFLESELDQARRAALPGGGDDRVSRLDGQVKVLKLQVENLEEARLREESRRIEAEEELRELGCSEEEIQEVLAKITSGSRGPTAKAKEHKSQH